MGRKHRGRNDDDMSFTNDDEEDLTVETDSDTDLL